MIYIKNKQKNKIVKDGLSIYNDELAKVSSATATHSVSMSSSWNQVADAIEETSNEMKDTEEVIEEEGNKIIDIFGRIHDAIVQSAAPGIGGFGGGSSAGGSGG